jgi:hypothetical protein
VEPGNDGDGAVISYFIEHWCIQDIRPSLENDDLYGEIKHDEQMEALIDSIHRLGLEEPLIVTKDGFILSGHRRYYAVLGWPQVPVRVKADIGEGEDPMKIRCEIRETTLENEEGFDVQSVCATCPRCGHETESFGTSERSVKRCLVLMREECPKRSHAFYVA